MYLPHLALTTRSRFEADDPREDFFVGGGIQSGERVEQRTLDRFQRSHSLHIHQGQGPIEHLFRKSRHRSTMSTLRLPIFEGKKGDQSLPIFLYASNQRGRRVGERLKGTCATNWCPATD